MNPHHSLTMHIRDALNANANRTTSSLRSIQKCLNHVYLLVQLKSYRVGKNLMQRRLRGLTTWRDMLENALRGTLKSVNNKVEQLYKVSHPCLDDHQFKKEEFEAVGDLSEVCSQIVLKCLYLARNGRPDILWSVNNFARAVTKWTQACDKRLARLISHIGNTAQHCRCEGDGDVVGVVTPLVRGGAQVLDGDQVVELSGQLEVQEREEKGEDGEGQVEVEGEKGELKERRTWMTMRMI